MALSCRPPRPPTARPRAGESLPYLQVVPPHTERRKATSACMFQQRPTGSAPICRARQSLDRAPQAPQQAGAGRWLASLPISTRNALSPCTPAHPGGGMWQGPLGTWSLEEGFASWNSPDLAPGSCSLRTRLPRPAPRRPHSQILLFPGYGDLQRDWAISVLLAL